MHRIYQTLIFVAIFALSVFAANEADQAARNFSLVGTDDATHSLSDYPDAKATVILFIATQCPVSNSFNERMVELANMYQPKGVVFLGINSNKAEKMDEVKQHATKQNFPFVVLKDENNVVADQYNAKVTPEVFVLSAQGELLYHGRIDDSPQAAERKSQDLADALDAILSGKKVNTPETKAFGCTIKRISL